MESFQLFITLDKLSCLAQLNHDLLQIVVVLCQKSVLVSTDLQPLSTNNL